MFFLGVSWLIANKTIREKKTDYLFIAQCTLMDIFKKML